MSFRDQAIQTIRDHQTELAEMGVVHAATFGSVARGDDRADSDVDVMFDVDPVKVRSIVAMGHIQFRLERWMGRPVDVVRRDRLRPSVATEAEQEAVHAF